MQRRLLRKRHLEIFLSRIKPLEEAKPIFEQYTIPVETAAGLLYIATYAYNNIINKTVVDLGCGTGRLAFGALWCGAKEVIGIDIDRRAVQQARNYAKAFGLAGKTQWIIGDIEALRGEFDTVIQNPPFGVQKPKADRKFLEKALEIGHTIYSLHKCDEKGKIFENLLESKTRFMMVSPSPFLKNFIKNHGGEIKAVYATVMTIPYMFKFHRKPKHKFVACLYVIEKCQIL